MRKTITIWWFILLGIFTVVNDNVELVLQQTNRKG